MRGKSSLSMSKNGGVETERLETLNEPHLSGAYIRNLVKQLSSSSSSRTKESSSSSLEGDGDGNSSNGSLFGNSCDGFSDQKREKSPPPPQPHKKKVRRRLHTSRPYQERLLNMAEARREIVTALKFHRASMKKASEQQLLQQKMEVRRNPRVYASNSLIPDRFPATTEEIQCMEPPASVAEFEDSGLHPVMDDKEIAEIRSIGDQHQMEWDDTLNLVNSAWWFKFLKEMEITPENQSVQDFVNYPFDEVMEFPAWLNTAEHGNDFCSDNYFEDPALPCMDIEEIEGMDGDWLASA
ncbi:uncharacterized protein LOC125212241 isoform X6 [Salvia hispanica]|uniref:uncharacterized protein LOC125212241 isoform X6 n=1 Tax=Salvia hispanica TaxID=49212 RepID=UPI002009BF87|nr:uncharacterized protein LOC125212241 isoform X6 [Salvia hispanica]